MSVIVPTVLSPTPEEYKESLGRVHTFVDRVHVDFSDGTLAPSKTIDINQIWWPKDWKIDIHAMVADPSQYVDDLLALNPSLILFHAEVAIDLLPVLAKIRESGVKAGIVLLRSTVPSDVANLIENCDHVMIFSGNLGEYGGAASMMQLEKVRLIKNINAGVEIGWDGGVTPENAFSLVQGNVDVLNVGGAIQKAENPKAVYDALVKEINKQGAV